MKLETIERGGERFVLVPEPEYRRLTEDDGLPPLPPADANGNREAIAFARASIARSLIQDRRAAGLTQAELAKLAHVRQETISRIESAKHTPTVRSIDKIYAALDRLKAKSQRRADGTARRKRAG